MFFCAAELSEVTQGLVVILNSYIQMGSHHWMSHTLLMRSILCLLCG